MNKTSDRFKLGNLLLAFILSLTLSMCTQGKEATKETNVKKQTKIEAKADVKKEETKTTENKPSSASKADSKQIAKKETAKPKTKAATPGTKGADKSKTADAKKNDKKDSVKEDTEKKDAEKKDEVEDDGAVAVPRVSNTVLLGGDILIEEELQNFIDDFGKDYPIKKLQSVLAGHDIVFANLEAPIGTEGEKVTGKPYSFLVHPKYAEGIKKMHLDVVSIANNHTMDYGEKALYSTINWLNSNKIKYVGAGANLEDARKPVIFNKKGVEFVFLAYNERPPASFYAKKDSPGTASANLEEISEDIKKYKRKDNIVMVSMHWGIENTLYPQSYQTVMARAIIDAGADVLIGHHPHWIQGVEIYKKKPIFYSLGNLLNGFYNRVEQDGFVAVLVFKGITLRRVEIIPIAGQNSLTDFQPYRMTGKEADAHLEFIGKISAKFRTRVIVKNNTGYIYIYDE